MWKPYQECKYAAGNSFLLIGHPIVILLISNN